MDSVENEILADKADQDRTFRLGEIPAAAASQSRLPISFREKFDIAEQGRRSWENVCIYRVPRGMRDVHNKAFDPRILSIGPYHSGKEGLIEMDQHKWRCLHQVLNRTNQDVSLYLDSIREIEEQARSCYDEPIDLTSDQFVEMMVLDGCFLLELFQFWINRFKGFGYSRNDPVFGRRGPWVLIRGDIIKLENQLPLFILDRLLALQIGNSYEEGLVIELILQFMVMDERRNNPRLIESCTKCLHCLDVFRESLLPLVDQETQATQKHRFIDFMTKLRRPWQSTLKITSCVAKIRKSLLPPIDHKSQTKQKHRFIDFMTKLGRAWHRIRLRLRSSETVNQSAKNIIHCVTKLREAGIKLKTGESDCFLDIKFQDGVLKMPRLVFQDSIKWELPNLIAFEQCHLDCGNDITSYASFMDALIDTSEDVGYLHNGGILELCGGSYNEVADFFNRLCDQVTVPRYGGCLWETKEKLAEQVDRYYNNRWNKWWVNMKRTYFSNPWSIISLIAAIVLVVLTFLQTFYGMYGYYRPK